METLVCQCPEPGNSHFYEEQFVRGMRQAKGVNALNRATAISTRVEAVGWNCR